MGNAPAPTANDNFPDCYQQVFSPTPESHFRLIYRLRQSHSQKWERACHAISCDQTNQSSYSACSVHPKSRPKPDSRPSRLTPTHDKARLS